MAPSRVSVFGLCSACLLALGCGEHQYLVVPGAEATDWSDTLDARDVTFLTPGGVTVLDGALALKVGERARLRVDFGTGATFPVTQLWLWVMNPQGKIAGSLELPLTSEQVAAGSAELELRALDEAPGPEVCAPGSGAPGTCYAEVDDGIDSIFALPSSATAAGHPGTQLPVTLPPLTSGSSSSCAGFTAAKCCAGQPGISAVACYVDKACGCPAGTDIGPEKADGTVTCFCP
jgi:hypothetical protein